MVRDLTKWCRTYLLVEAQFGSKVFGAASFAGTPSTISTHLVSTAIDPSGLTLWLMPMAFKARR